MQLQPKARPVRINKLKLQGAEINTLNDLKEHFYVREIINLGPKFVLWLDRNEDTSAYCSQVSEILNKTASIDLRALLLINLFFNNEERSLYSVLDRFHQTHNDPKILLSILHCLEPSEYLAVELLKRYENEDWLMPWLADFVHRKNLAPDFQYILAKALLAYDRDLAQRMIQEARAKGCRKDLIKEIEIINEFTINIAGNKVKFKKVSFPTGDFFMTCDEIPSWLCKHFHADAFVGKDNRGNKRNLNEFRSLLSVLNRETGFVWDLPTVDEWRCAYYAHIFNKVPTVKEWCTLNNEIYWILNPDNCSKTGDTFYDYLLHAVIRIKDNPRLQ